MGEEVILAESTAQATPPSLTRLRGLMPSNVRATGSTDCTDPASYVPWVPEPTKALEEM